jgi:hypothetical protein
VNEQEGVMNGKFSLTSAKSSVLEGAVALLATTWMLAASAGVAASQPHDASTFAVVVHDYAHTSPADLNVARQVVLRIFHDAGIETAWVQFGTDAFAQAEATYPGGPDAFVQSAIFVNLQAVDRQARDDAKTEVLGRAAPGTHFAWIFCQRVNATAAQNRQSSGELLGHVIAHEIGHLLLPSGAHSPNGIMAAVMDLDLVQQGGLHFLGRQPELIRARLADWNRFGQRP